MEHCVRDFVARQTRRDVTRIASSTTLVGDLHLAGDDGSDFMAAFAREFGVDLSDFDSARHFGREAGCFLPVSCYYYIRAIFLEAHRAAGLQPISVRDLVVAAERGRWQPRSAETAE
jgi:hypothetical protein